MVKGSDTNKKHTGVATTKKTANNASAECKRTMRDRKSRQSEKTEKTYKVIVTYIQLSEEEAAMKRSIVESILKQGSKRKDAG